MKKLLLTTAFVLTTIFSGAVNADGACSKEIDDYKNYVTDNVIDKRSGVNKTLKAYSSSVKNKVSDGAISESLSNAMTVLGTYNTAIEAVKTSDEFKAVNNCLSKAGLTTKAVLGTWLPGSTMATSEASNFKQCHSSGKSVTCGLS